MANTILVSNDDGIESPLLAPLLSSLKGSFPSNNISFVVPDREQSWISQAISRRTPIEVKETEFAGISGYQTSGFPADCVNLGVDNLFKEKPALVVSGINIGVNAGLPFYLYSGTVAAARAAFLRGVRAIAVSLSMPEEIFKIWHEKDLNSFEQYKERFTQIAQVASGICQKLSKEQFWDGVDFYNLNLPWDTSSESEVAFCNMDNFRIRQIFKQREDGKYIHKFDGLEETNPSDKGDFLSVQAGKISISPLSYKPESLIPNDLIEDVSSKWKSK